MKKLFILALFLTLCMCGCDFALEHSNSILVFSARPINRETASPKMIQDTFGTGQLIHFCIYSKEPFNSNEGRIQIIKKDPNTQIYGFSMVQTLDINPIPGKNFCTGTFTVYTDGYYMARVFLKTSPKEPIAQKLFWITKEDN